MTIMQTLVIDTNGIVKKLEQRGFSRAQAEGITDALMDLDTSSLATKTDIQALKLDFEKASDMGSGRHHLRAGRSSRCPHRILEVRMSPPTINAHREVSTPSTSRHLPQCVCRD